MKKKEKIVLRNHIQENSHKPESVTRKNEVDDFCGFNEINPIFLIPLGAPMR